MYEKKSHRNYLTILNLLNSDKKTIVFDLDETLVRCQDLEPLEGLYAIIKVIDPEKEDTFVRQRPNNKIVYRYLCSADQD